MHKDEYNFCFRGDNHITNKVRVVSLACNMPTGPPLHPYQILSNYRKHYGSYSLHNNQIMKTVRVISCSQQAYLSSSYFPLNITKICLRVSKLWCTQGWAYNFCFSGDNYLTNDVRLVSLACDTPTGPPLYPDQILSNYLKHYGSYSLHKISASGEITT